MNCQVGVVVVVSPDIKMKKNHCSSFLPLFLFFLFLLFLDFCEEEIIPQRELFIESNFFFLPLMWMILVFHVWHLGPLFSILLVWI